MLRLWRDLYRIVLHPERVSLVRVQQGRFSKAEAVSTTATIRTATLPAWRGALEHLEETIAGIASAKADVEIVLSNHFVRYAVIPWSSEVTGGTEVQALTRISFEEVYGDLAADWELRLSDAGYGKSRLACAVDHELIQAVTDAVEKTSLRLVSIQPFLMAAFNHCQKLIPDDEYLLMLDEPGKLCLARVRDRQWSQIRLHSVGNLVDELPGLLNREVLLNGSDKPAKEYLFSLEHIQDNLPVTDMQSLSFSAANNQPEVA